jgi:hypothetical protein
MSLEWCLNKVYNLGEQIVYKNKFYKCIESHTSLLEYGYPDQTNGILWSNDIKILESNEIITIWGINKVYKKGDIVKFDCNLYYCIKNNLSNIMNSPPHKRDDIWKLLDYSCKSTSCKL